MTSKASYRQLLLRILLLTVLLFSSTAATAIRRERLVDSWRPQHYRVNLTLSDQLSEITSALVEIDVIAVKKLSLIDLDFGDLITDTVTVNLKPASFEHRNGKLAIRLPEAVAAGSRLKIAIGYHGIPKDGLILTSDKDGKPSAVGDNWPDRVHYWIPCLDHPSAKATVTFNITAPARNLVVANGRLDHVETRNTTNRTWTYSEAAPIPPYCMIIAVGEFARLETLGALTPLSFYVPQSDREYAVKGFAPAAPALMLFSQTVAPYPYEKLALIIGATRFGGMENSSAIVFTQTLFNQNPTAQLSRTFGIPTGTVHLIAHEIAHQWFGDSVTESTWADLWLSEGFATYFAGLFIERQESEEAFQAYMKQAAETAFAYENRTRTPVFDRDTEDLFKLLNPNNYEKGAWILHMLRSRLGDEAFFRGIRDYYQSHKEATASTEDLRKALEKSSRQDLKGFFRRWVYESGHPQYELSWQWQAQKTSLSLVLRQLQAGNAFFDPVPLTIITAAGRRDLTLKPTSKKSSHEMRLEDQPTAIELDPHSTLLKEATVKEK